MEEAQAEQPRFEKLFLHSEENCFEEATLNGPAACEMHLMEFPWLVAAVEPWWRLLNQLQLLEWLESPIGNQISKLMKTTAWSQDTIPHQSPGMLAAMPA